MNAQWWQGYRHKAGFFNFGYIVSINPENLTAQVSIVYRDQHGVMTRTVMTFSLFEIERTVTTEEAERAASLIDDERGNG